MREARDAARAIVDRHRRVKSRLYGVLLMDGDIAVEVLYHALVREIAAALARPVTSPRDDEEVTTDE